MSTSRTFKSILFTLFLITTIPGAQAQALDGEYTLDLGSDACVWDISGTYFESIGDGFLETQYTIVQDADGKFTGAGTFDVDLLGVHMDGDIDIGGQISGTCKKPRVVIVLRMTGGGFGGGATFEIDATGTARGAINAALRQMVGRIQVRACVSGDNGQKRVRRCAAQGEPFAALIPDPNMDGSFDFQFNVATTDTAVAGNGRATLSNGEFFNYSVSGLFNTRRNISSLVFTPMDGSGLITLKKVAASDGGPTVGTVKGNIAGQKINGRIQ